MLYKKGETVHSEHPHRAPRDAAGLTAHTAIVLFRSSKFLERDELGHSVGLARS